MHYNTFIPLINLLTLQKEHKQQKENGKTKTRRLRL
jgi:hypothetical protein